jgi:hypothetical protein
VPHGRVHPQPVGIVRVLIPRQPAEYRLAQERRHRVLRVFPCSGIAQLRARHLRQAEDIIEFPVRQQPGIARHLDPVELHSQLTVELDPACPVPSLTYSVHLRPVA